MSKAMKAAREMRMARGNKNCFFLPKEKKINKEAAAPMIAAPCQLEKTGMRKR
jgi:hypothetical protein